MGTIKGKSIENGSISGKSIFDGGKLFPSHEGTPTEELEKQIAYLLAQVTLLEKIKANKNEIPKKLSELLSDRLHRTVTDEDIERWNNNEADLFYYVNLPETLDISPVTPQEIFNAVENGKFPVAIVLINGSYNIVPFCLVDENYSEAIIIYNRATITIHINQNKSIEVIEHYLAEMSDIPDVSQFITKYANDLVYYYNKEEIESKLYYDASYLFETQTLTQEQFEGLKNAIQNNIRIITGENNERYVIMGTIDDTNNISVTITIGSVDYYNSEPYANNIVALFTIDASTYNVTLEIGQINGADIQRALDSIPTKTSDLTNDSDFVNINEVYPVGSIVNTKTNSNPSSSYGGTWSLIGKNFIGLASGLATIFTANTTNVSNVVRTMERIGNIITLHLELTTAVALSDNAVNLGTVNFANIGITRLWSSIKQVPCGTDDGNGIALLSIDYETGAVQSTDVITKTSGGTIPAGSTIEANFVLNIPQSYMIDSFCNRFTWERTA